MLVQTVAGAISIGIRADSGFYNQGGRFLGLFGAASGRPTSLEDTAADATSRLEIGAVLVERLGKMSAASRVGMLAVLIMPVLMISRGFSLEIYHVRKMLDYDGG